MDYCRFEKDDLSGHGGSGYCQLRRAIILRTTGSPLLSGYAGHALRQAQSLFSLTCYAPGVLKKVWDCGARVRQLLFARV